MLCHGRLAVLLFATLVGMAFSRYCIAAYPPGSLHFQESQVETRPNERAIASKRTRDSVITITNTDGRLQGGDNDFCVLFERRDTRKSVDVQNVSVDFTLLVGRMQEKPIRTPLAQDQSGRYCGHVNLRKQYYVPASYYAFVLYKDAGGKKRKARLFVSVK